MTVVNYKWVLSNPDLKGRIMTEEISHDEDLESGEGISDEADTEREEQEELTQLLEEFEDLKDRHLRLAAEFNNFKRRSEQERLESWSRAQADILSGFLDVLDDLNRVTEVEVSSATVEGVLEGIILVEKKACDFLHDSGAEIIDPSKELFDPERMEAIMSVPVEDVEKDNTVAQVFQRGCILKGILVRPARVSVHKHG